jgi:molybdate/tungstate transport system substrate-binding protein
VPLKLRPGEVSGFADMEAWQQLRRCWSACSFRFMTCSPGRLACRAGMVFVTLLALFTFGCTGGDERSHDERTIVVVNAGSLARPLRTALTAFTEAQGLAFSQENSGSLEAARKVAELGQRPDVIALADFEVFPALLMPDHVSWYVQFARNRMVLAYTPGSRFADSLEAGNWWEVIQRPGVETGRADPALDPAGYRALLLFQLAERHLSVRGLALRLEAAAPQRNVRPKAADLVALLQAGEIDYFWGYESVARAAGLQFVALPPEIDLGSPEHAELYAHATVAVPGRTPADTLTLRGEPILYALSIPHAAPNPAGAEAFVRFLFSPEGRELLRREHLDVLDSPILVGEGAPPGVVAITAPPATP